MNKIVSFDEDIRNKVLDAMSRKSLTAAGLADLCGVSSQQINRFLSGTHGTTTHSLTKMIKHLPDYFSEQDKIDQTFIPVIGQVRQGRFKTLDPTSPREVAVLFPPCGPSLLAFKIKAVTIPNIDGAYVFFDRDPLEDTEDVHEFKGVLVDQNDDWYFGNLITQINGINSKKDIKKPHIIRSFFEPKEIARTKILEFRKVRFMRFAD